MINNNKKLLSQVGDKNDGAKTCNWEEYVDYNVKWKYQEWMKRFEWMRELKRSDTEKYALGIAWNVEYNARVSI